MLISTVCLIKQTGIFVYKRVYDEFININKSDPASTRTGRDKEFYTLPNIQKSLWIPHRIQKYYKAQLTFLFLNCLTLQIWSFIAITGSQQTLSPHCPTFLVAVSKN